MSQSGKIIITGGWDHRIKVLSFETGQEIKTFSGHQNLIFSVKNTLDSKMIVSADYGGKIKIWKTFSKNKEIKSLFGHRESIRSVVITKNSRLIVSCSHDSTIRIWGIFKRK